jgi:type I restriction enzyme S subunit
MVPFGEIRATAEQVSTLASEEVFRGQQVPAGTLLMSFKLSIGRTSVLALDSYHNEAIVSIQPSEAVDRDFLRFYLPTIDFTGHQDRAIKGHTLNRGKIDQLPIVLPPLVEQKAIARTLLCMQKRSVVVARQLEALKTLKHATMTRLFREGLRSEPRVDSQIGEIPRSWRVATLGSACEIQSGGTPDRRRSDYWAGGIPWVKTGEINYRPITHTEETISKLGLRNSSARVFPAGTILLAMYGQGVTRGKVAILGIAAATNQACAAVTPDSQLDPLFLYAFLAASYDRIRNLGHGANQKNLSAEIIRTIEIPIPPDRTEQREIAAVAQALESSIELHSTKAALLDEAFQRVLRALMTGQVRIEAAVNA